MATLGETNNTLGSDKLYLFWEVSGVNITFFKLFFRRISTQSQSTHFIIFDSL